MRVADNLAEAPTVVVDEVHPTAQGAIAYPVDHEFRVTDESLPTVEPARNAAPKVRGISEFDVP
jgi:hypothetical protein